MAAEGLGLGYLQAELLYGALIAAVALAYYRFKMNGILGFWLAYILTRPMGASFGDLLSQPISDGGLGFGTTNTSLIFFLCIALIVGYMTATHEGLEKAADLRSSQRD